MKVDVKFPKKPGIHTLYYIYNNNIYIRSNSNHLFNLQTGTRYSSKSLDEMSNLERTQFKPVPLGSVITITVE